MILNLIAFGTAQFLGQKSCQAMLAGMFGFCMDLERHLITFLFQLLLCFLHENFQAFANRRNAQIQNIGNFFLFAAVCGDFSAGGKPAFALRVLGWACLPVS